MPILKVWCGSCTSTDQRSSKEVSGGSFRSYGSNYGWVLLGCVLQGLLNCKSWVTVRVAGAKKSNRGVTFSGRRSIVGGVCCARRCGPLRAVAGRCGPVRAALPLCAAFYCLVCGFHRPLGGAVPCGLLVCASRGGAVPCGLLVCASRGWRRVIGIGDQGVVWVAPCHWDC